MNEGDQMNYNVRRLSMLYIIIIFLSFMSIQLLPAQQVPTTDRVEGKYKLPNIVPALDSQDDLPLMTNATSYIPVNDYTFTEHIRGLMTEEEKKEVKDQFDKKLNLPGIEYMPDLSSDHITSMAITNGIRWIGTKVGLYKQPENSKKAERLVHYGHRGPLATEITALANDSHGILYVGTPVGLSILDPEGTWKSIQGRQGLPVEHITALSIDKNDRLWIGTTHGAVLYTPYEEGRQWYYRAGKRYLIDDRVNNIYISIEGMPVYFNTDEGISKIEGINMTLLMKAEKIEDRTNKWHRRLGLVAACLLDNAENPTSYTIGDNDNDGLWTAYHVVAMSLAYGATGEKLYLESAKKGMHALVMLQNASGIPGLVARSVVTDRGR